MKPIIEAKTLSKDYVMGDLVVHALRTVDVTIYLFTESFSSRRILVYVLLIMCASDLPTGLPTLLGKSKRKRRRGEERREEMILLPLSSPFLTADDVM